MELNDKTMNVLKNFSSINPNLLIQEGNTVKTISEARNVVATAVVEEAFPKKFGIYDLNEFIGVLGLVDTPNLRFEEEHVLVSDSTGRSKVKYFFSPEETLTSPTKDINMPEPEVKFTLDNDTLNRIRKAAATLGHTEVSIIPSGGGILSLSVVDTSNSTSNAYTIDIDGEYTASDFNFVISIANLKILPGDYEVSISSKRITEFKHKELNVRYWIAVEQSSKFGD